MKKLKILLDESSVLNFKFFVELFKRYPSGVVFLPLLVVGFSIYFYIGQHDIYTETISFKNTSGETSSATDAIASLLGQKTDQMLTSDVLGFHSSVNFNQELAEKLYDHPKFETLNFNNILSKDIVTHKQMFFECEDKTCATNKLRLILPGLWRIEEDRIVKRNFKIVVNTLDRKTTHIILNELKDHFVNSRVKSIRHSLVQQRQLTEDLIEKKKKDFNLSNVLELRKEREVIKSKIFALGSQLNILRPTLFNKKNLLENVSLKVKEKREMNSNANFIEKSKKIEDLENKISDLRKNIVSIENSSRGRTGRAENNILKALKKDLRSKEFELKRLNPGRKISSISSSNESSRNAEIKDYSVLKQEVAGLEKEFNEYSSQLVVLEKKRSEIKTYLMNNKSSLDYLKLLENKLIQIQLIENTVVSDILFDNYSSGIFAYKRTTPFFIAIFSLALSIFLIFNWLVIRYYFDDRVFSKEEIAFRFSDIPILGATPKFNKDS